MSRWLWRAARVQFALGTLAGSAVLLGWTVWQALQPDRIDVPAPVTDDRSVEDTPRVTAYTVEHVLDAVVKDPFHPERRRPGARFQLPADLAATAQHAEPQAPDQSLRVIGTAVAPDGGGFAMCAWAGGSPRIVRVGEHAGAWVLTRVSPGVAEFATAAGQAVVVRVPKAGT